MPESSTRSTLSGPSARTAEAALSVEDAAFSCAVGSAENTISCGGRHVLGFSA
jgi:hypothetical protein